jgi:hypothetical protein
MNRTEFIALFADNVYQGEVWGEALFDAWMSLEKDPQRRRKLANLVQLETEMKAKLRPLAFRLGLDLAHRDFSDKVKGAREFYGSSSWHDVIARLRDGTAKFIAIFEQLEAAASNDDETRAMADMLVHERALHTFAVLEIEGKPAQSLEPIQRLLVHPI